MPAVCFAAAAASNLNLLPSYVTSHQSARNLPELVY